MERLRQTTRKSRHISIFQAIKEKLDPVNEVAWEEQKGERSIIIGEENIVLKDNRIKTSRYNAISFLPLNLYEQFSKVSNVYFLLMGLFQMIPWISNSSGIPTVYLPLMFILFVAALKDMLEDLNRHRSDKDENHTMTRKAVRVPDKSARVSSRLSLGGTGKFVDVYSEELRVGSIIKIR